MSWISDVKGELERLRRGKGELRKFGLLVGGAFIVVAVVGLLKHWSGALLMTTSVLGALLLLAGWLSPKILTRAYGVWMGIAFALGWVVSRVILIILFYAVLSPLGMIARLAGKKFIDTGFGVGRESYWVARTGGKKIDYDKMV